jgi:hypothetical protein
MRKQITLDFDDKFFKNVEKRGKENYLSVKEQLKDIIVRSMANWGKKRKPYGDPQVSKMVKIFSRKKPGPKKK